MPAERIEVGGLLDGNHFQIVVADDVVAVEDGASFVAGDHHGDPLRYGWEVPRCSYRPIDKGV